MAGEGSVVGFLGVHSGPSYLLRFLFPVVLRNILRVGVLAAFFLLVKERYTTCSVLFSAVSGVVSPIPGC